MKTKSMIAAASMMVVISLSAAHASPNLTTLVNFNGANGEQPDDAGGLLIDSSGNLFGTTTNGGSSNDGTIFEVAAGTDSFSTLVTFTGPNGVGPVGSVIADSSGNLYGTTYYGDGALANYGTIFKITAGTNALTTLGSFSGSNSRIGGLPDSKLLLDASGNLYGTTTVGGDNTIGLGYGTVFKLAAGTDQLSTLATFEGTNGASPQGSLISDAAGNFYGTTKYGGSSNDGTVFKITPGSNNLSTVVTFNGSNGSNPLGGVIADASGNLYGTTFVGGSSNDGTIFKIAAGTNTLTTLVNFNGSNGSGPASLICDAAGNLFGSTDVGGLDNDGTIFEIAAGTETVTLLASFNGTDGLEPGDLTADASGNIYGTTYGGGSSDDGTVFELTGTGFVVPEPSSLLLLGVGGIALLARRRGICVCGRKAGE